jgi:hypothetical protein
MKGFFGLQYAVDINLFVPLRALMRMAACHSAAE